MKNILKQDKEDTLTPAGNAGRSEISRKIKGIPKMNEKLNITKRIP